MFLCKSKLLLFGGITAVLVVVGGIVGALIVFFVNKAHPTASVVANGHECAHIGGEIFKKGGNAVEASIATLFCEGVAMPQSCGLGGGFLMTFYERKTGKVHVLNARETAPANANASMFQDHPQLIKRGVLSAAVPGELAGYGEAYRKFGGNVKWADLVQPTIEICKKGILVTSYLAKVYKLKKELLYADPILRESFINKTTNQTYIEGQYVKRLRLAKTLEIIAEEGADALYGGSLTKDFVGDIQGGGGIITEADMVNYKPVWQEPIVVNLTDGNILYTVPLPGSGVILAYILNIVKRIFDFKKPESNENVQRIVESFKFGYGRRTELGDIDSKEMRELVNLMASEEQAISSSEKISVNWTSQDPAYYGAEVVNPDDHGTAHVSVLAANGDAVSATTTINLYFGAGVGSISTGIILNDEMDDFSIPSAKNTFGLPPSKVNFIHPHRRPLSSMCPAIVIDKNKEVRLVTGAAGGSKITSSVALVIINHLWYKMDLQKSLDADRYHHQLFPMELDLEANFHLNPSLLSYLESVGHKTLLRVPTGFSAVTSISNESGLIEAAYDTRRLGTKYYVY